MGGDDVVEVLSLLHFVPQLVPGALQHLHSIKRLKCGKNYCFLIYYTFFACCPSTTVTYVNILKYIINSSLTVLIFFKLKKKIDIVFWQF